MSYHPRIITVIAIPLECLYLAGCAPPALPSIEIGPIGPVSPSEPVRSELGIVEPGAQVFVYGVQLPSLPGFTVRIDSRAIEHTRVGDGLSFRIPYDLLPGNHELLIWDNLHDVPFLEATFVVQEW